MLTDEKQTVPQTSMTMSEIMTIAICFHLSHYREFKWYYLECICGEHKDCFPKLLSYNRFVEVMQWVTAPLTVSTSVI